MKPCLITLLFLFINCNLVFPQNLSKSNPTSENSIFKVKSVLVIPKIGAIRSIGLNAFNDDLANAGIKQLPVIGITSGVEFNVQILNIGLGIDYQSFTYSNEVLNLYSPSKGAKNSVEISGKNLSLLLSYNVLGKNENYRLDPYIGVGTQSTDFSMNTTDSVYTYNQLISGAKNSFHEPTRSAAVFIAGMKLIAHSKNNFDFFLQTDYRYMAPKYKWSTSNLPISRLSGVNVSIGLVVDLIKVFGQK